MDYWWNLNSLLTQEELPQFSTASIPKGFVAILGCMVIINHSVVKEIDNVAWLLMGVVPGEEALILQGSRAQQLG